MKTYSVWVEVSIEEHDDETDKYRDVGLDFETREVYDEPDPDEFKILETVDISEADALASNVYKLLEGKMNCSNCGAPITPANEMTNYDLTLVLFYKSRRCITCNTNTGETYHSFLTEFARRLDLYKEKEKK